MFLKSSLYTSVCAIVLMLAACSRVEKGSDIVMDQAPHAHQLRVVNVLDAKEYNDAHIKGSIHVPFEKVTDEAKNWQKDDTIVIYCSNYLCGASKIAAKQLKDLGFTDVSVYEGGMAEWFKLGQTDATFIVEGPATEQYLTFDVQKPAEEVSDVQAVSAQALKQKMQEAGLLA